eukprot:30941-Pelagococcus_subviridis.AAC.19
MEDFEGVESERTRAGATISLSRVASSPKLAPNRRSSLRCDEAKSFFFFSLFAIVDRSSSSSSSSAAAAAAQSSASAPFGRSASRALPTRTYHSISRALASYRCTSRPVTGSLSSGCPAPPASRIHLGSFHTSDCRGGVQRRQ